ncbi:DUF2617 family protein [Natrinema altunense]|uniref:DUF2617 family protein n=1 Tax=Natrinema altunense (strain JCM 12890 / CGMCC 1.3731 / AJ2) TaxID=1227494 RepID=L9ZF03_NATA2|nr:DUF2617 family protein [Natrinema altunense]ELY84621.1 hypothetical protein C485_14725 [Natrinema altunense JCM 12890]
MSRQTLQFVHTNRPPTTDDIRVFDSRTRALLGTEFTFRIIGSSHYVSAPEYEFYEVSTCDPDPVANHEGTAIPLETDRPPRALTFETDAFRCVTRVEHRPLSAFPRDRYLNRPDSFDLAYAFGGDPDAVTTIEIDDDGYETYHTYPEFDLALYTRTVFGTDRDPAALEASAARTAESDAI